MTNVEEKMAKTNMDFYSTSSSFYQRGGTAGMHSRELSTRLKGNSPPKSSRVSPVSRTLSPSKKSDKKTPKNSDMNYIDKEEMQL